ncbi:MAG: thioredoxin domain-containing protein [archaeon]|jgi:protein-disulfide isomerase|nr:thioredoxin domain-containing protein [archaeon]
MVVKKKNKIAKQKTSATTKSTGTTGRRLPNLKKFLDEQNTLAVAVIAIFLGLVIGVYALPMIMLPTDQGGAGQAGVIEAAGPTAVASKVLNYINANLLAEGTVASNAVAEPFGNSLYKVTFSIPSQGGSDETSVFATVDGETMFITIVNQNMFNLDTPLPAPADPVPQDPPAQPPAAEVSADDDAFVGPEDAKVVVVEFSDFECPYCAAAVGKHELLISRFKESDPSWEPAVPYLKELAAEGKIKFVYRDYPLGGHSKAQKAAEAAECAAEQGKFWEMHDLIFDNLEAGTIAVVNLKQFAVDLELDTEAFNTCLDSGEMAAEVQSDMAEGSSYGVNGTPAFFVNGILVSGAQPASVFETIIEQELAK